MKKWLQCLLTVHVWRESMAVVPPTDHCTRCWRSRPRTGPVTHDLGHKLCKHGVAGDLIDCERLRAELADMERAVTMDAVTEFGNMTRRQKRRALAADPLLRERHIRNETLRSAAKDLQGKATARFASYGAGDARGAALWDAACYLVETLDDGRWESG